MEKEGKQKRREFTVICWKSVEERPENGRYVLLQCLDEYGGLSCDCAAYENGRFLHIYDQQSWGEVNEACILGWSYFPFDN